MRLPLAALALFALAACTTEPPPKSDKPPASDAKENGSQDPVDDTEATETAEAEPKDDAPDPTPDEQANPGRSEDVAPSKNYAQGPSAGCTKATGATGLQTRTMTIAKKTREYLRFIPAGYAPKKPVALVLGLHGSGGTSSRARE